MYKDLKQPIIHLPKELVRIKIACQNCTFKYEPDWLTKTKEPFTPVIPNDNKTGKGMWRPTAKLIKCPKCGFSNKFDFPLKEVNSRYLLYGDEAYRDFANKLVITYTLVGTNRKMIPIIDEKIFEFKKALFPNISPDSWKIHMTEIWSTEKRQKTLFKDYNKKDILDFVKKLCNLIREMDNGFIIYNFSSITKRPIKLTKHLLNQRKTEIYSLLILRIIQEMTSQGIRPELIFDSEKPNNEENIIHEWADRAFQGLQSSTLYAYLSGGNLIPEPKFVTPAKYPSLEIADFISFIIARFCFRKLKNESIDINPTMLGKLYYLGFENNIDFVYCYQDSYPWDLFYKNYGA